MTTRIVTSSHVLAIACTCLLAPTAAHAAGGKSYLSLAATQTEDTSRADSSTGKDLVTIFNISAAYVQGPGLALGGKYFNYNQNGRSTEDTGTEISGFGPMIGFMHDSGIFANLAYLYEPEKVYEDDDGKTTFYDGSGYVIDIGKVFEMGAWGAGAQVSYSKVEYEEVKSSGSGEQDLSGEWYDTSLYPYVNVFVFF